MVSNLKMLPMWIVWYLFSESQDRENRTEVEQPSSEILSGILRGGLNTLKFNRTGKQQLVRVKCYFYLGKNCGDNEDFRSFLLCHTVFFAR